jgi:DNA modification methylase
MGCFEIAFYGWRKGAAHQFFGPNNALDLWHVKKVNPQSMIHLTEKPVELAVRAMQYSSRAGENVLDLFGGSGSTLIAAEQTGRKAFLMELDAPYCDVIVQRWQNFTGKKAICEKAVAITEKTPAEAGVVGERTPDAVTC